MKTQRRKFSSLLSGDKNKPSFKNVLFDKNKEWWTVAKIIGMCAYISDRYRNRKWFIMAAVILSGNESGGSCNNNMFHVSVLRNKCLLRQLGISFYWKSKIQILEHLVCSLLCRSTLNVSFLTSCLVLTFLLFAAPLYHDSQLPNKSGTFSSVGASEWIWNAEVWFQSRSTVYHGFISSIWCRLYVLYFAAGHDPLLHKS